MSHDPPLHHRTPVLGPGHPVRRETVNVVITAVLLASLVCLLIMGASGASDGRARPSTEPPLTNGSPYPGPSGAALSGR